MRLSTQLKHRLQQPKTWFHFGANSFDWTFITPHTHTHTHTQTHTTGRHGSLTARSMCERPHQIQHTSWSDPGSHAERHSKSRRVCMTSRCRDCKRKCDGECRERTERHTRSADKKIVATVLVLVPNASQQEPSARILVGDGSHQQVFLHPLQLGCFRHLVCQSKRVTFRQRASK